MLTVTLTPKPFSGSVGRAQRLALDSLRALGPDVEIVMAGPGADTEAEAHRVGAHWVPDLQAGEEGLPLLPELLRAGRRRVSGAGAIMYANADIAFTPELIRAIAGVTLPSFVLTGRRFEVPKEAVLGERSPRLGELVGLARLHPAGDFGVDYFVFPRSVALEDRMPPLVVGRPGWDNWLIGWAREAGVPSIDASSVVTAMHLDSSPPVWDWSQPGSEANRSLAAAHLHLGLLDTTHAYQHGRVRPRRSPSDFLRRLQVRFRASPPRALC